MKFKEKNSNEIIFNAFEEGQYDLCLYLCIESIEYNCNNSYAWYYKGKTEFECKDYSDSIKSLKKAISIEPGATLFRANLAQSFAEIGDTKQAIKYFFQEIKKFPQSLYGWQVFVPFLVKHHRYSFAKLVCDRMVNSGLMNYAFLAEDYAECLYYRGTLEEELSFYEKLMELNIYSSWAKDNHDFVTSEITQRTDSRK